MAARSMNGSSLMYDIIRNQQRSFHEGRKRPRDPNQLAKLIVDIASGQVEDHDPTPEEQGKTPPSSAGRPLPSISNEPEERTDG
jgi:hypothetical protein